MRKIAGANKADALMRRVGDILTPASRMVFAKTSDSIGNARLVMRSHGARNLPVVAPARNPGSDEFRVLGLLTNKIVADYTSFVADGVGGKKSFLELMENRRGMPERTVSPRGAAAVKSGMFSSTGLSAEPSPSSPPPSPSDGGKAQSGARGLLRGKVLDLSVGAQALPHPFKTTDGVAQNRRDYGPGDEVKSATTGREFRNRSSYVHAQLLPLSGSTELACAALVAM